MKFLSSLAEMEQARDSYWSRYERTAPIRLRWRAAAVRHCFHVLPGESILEFGAGSGQWTERLSAALRGECPITAVCFNPELAERCRAKRIPNVSVAEDVGRELEGRQFDYIVGTAILSHRDYESTLALLYKLLKPGGQILFFEANFWNPQVLLKSLIPPLARWSGNAPSQIAIRRFPLMKAASHQGFVNLEVLPFDILHPLLPRRLIRFVQNAAFVVEQAPIIRWFCGNFFIWGRKPGEHTAPARPGLLAEHRELFDSTSVVIPCRNEAANIERLATRLVDLYGPYLREIIVVNDPGTDNTSEIVRGLMAREPKVKLIDRQPPGSFGRSLRDGVEAASGRYILTMDADFVLVAPELRDLFDAVAKGHDGAIGSRFSYDSVLINYPFTKVLSNRAFHLLVKLLLLPGIRDLSNNLKIYRSEIYKGMNIEERTFAASAETGLKPLASRYDIVETPISWIGRTADMGSSSFNIVGVAPDYFMTLMRLVWRTRRRRRPAVTTASTLTTGTAGE
mgnify:FL=1